MKSNKKEERKNEEMIAITWFSNKSEKESIEKEIQDFDFEEIETRGIEGTEELIRWIITTALGSPVISTLIDLIKEKISRAHKDRKVHGLTIRIGENVLIENLTPRQAIEILENSDKYIKQ